MLDRKIVEAVGAAGAASKYRGRAAFALELEQAMVAAITKAQKDGVTNPEIVRGYIQTARVAVRDKYKRLESSHYLTEEKLHGLAKSSA